MARGEADAEAAGASSASTAAVASSPSVFVRFSVGVLGGSAPVVAASRVRFLDVGVEVEEEEEEVEEATLFFFVRLRRGSMIVGRAGGLSMSVFEDYSIGFESSSLVFECVTPLASQLWRVF